MWRDFPLPDGSYSDPTRPWSQQDLVNYIPTFAEQSGTRTRARYTPAPGLQTFASVGSGPIRGMRDVEGTLFVVSGHTLYRVTKAGLATSLGTIPGSGLVCMTHNQITDGNQVVIGNGLTGYLYNTVTETFTQITDTAFPGLVSCDFLGQYIIGVEPQRRFWFHSDLVDATSYSDLNRYEAESAPDRIVGLIASHNEVLIFGERTIEPWVNEPTENAAFQRNSSAVIEKGCASGQTICRLDNSVYFLGNDKIVYRLEGYTPIPVSTKPMAAAFRDLDASRAFAFTYEDSGHVVYYLTFPDGQTWGYDVSTRRWHRRASFTLDRWRLNCLIKWNGGWIGGDFQNGKLYTLEWGFMYEGCEIMPRSLKSGVLHNNGNRAEIHGFKLLAHTGQASISPTGSIAPSVSGALPDAALGDTVDYQYTITRAFPGQSVTLTLSGTLPPGLTMSATGRVTGTLTTDGTYSWTITASSECADGTPWPDSITVPAAAISEFWMTPTTVSAADNQLWVSSNGASWPTATTRSPYTDDPSYGPVGAGIGAALIFKENSSTPATAERITSFNYASPLPVTQTAAPTNLGAVRDWGGVLVAIDVSGTPNTLRYSTDQGANWNSYTFPITASGSTNQTVVNVVRLSNGRWVAATGGIAPQYYYYSDQATPTGWVQTIRHDTTTSKGYLVTDGTAVCGFPSGILDNFYRTTDGEHWTLVTLAAHNVTPSINGIGFGSVMLMPMASSGSDTRLKRTSDHGQTWATITVDAANTGSITRFAYANGVVVCCAGAFVYYSTDDGVTWAASTLPTGASGGLRVGVIRRPA